MGLGDLGRPRREFAVDSDEKQPRPGDHVLDEDDDGPGGEVEASDVSGD
jgi:hypothetical protein